MSHSISIDAVQLLSTANPSPYWDDLAMKMEVIVEEPGSDELLVTAVEGRIGSVGAGGLVDVRPLLTYMGGHWQAELPPLSDGTSVSLRVTVLNVRDLDDLSVERLLAQIGILAATAAAFHFVPVPKDKIAAWAIKGLEAITGVGLEKLIDELLEDPPKCAGLVFSETKSFSGATIKAKPYISVPDEDFFKGIFTDTIAQSTPISSNQGCGTPKAIVAFSLHRAEPKLFAPPIGEFKTKILPVVDLGLSKIFGAWADDPFAPYPRVIVVIMPSNKPGTDLVDVSVRETLEHGSGQIVVNKTDPQMSAVLADRLIPGKNVYGVRDRSAIATLNPFVKAASKAPMQGGAGSTLLSSNDVANSGVSHNQLVVPPPGNIVPPPNNDLFNASNIIAEYLEISPISFAIGELLRSTMTIFLPDGIALSCWMEVLDAKGAKPELVVRYTRQGNLFVTRTDVWLSRHNPVK
jgi:hypothetical protein